MKFDGDLVTDDDGRVEVVAAVIVGGPFGGQLLLQQRPPGKEFAGMWECIGGKVVKVDLRLHDKFTVEAAHRRAVVREVREESGLCVCAVGDRVTQLKFNPPAVGRACTLTFYEVEVDPTAPKPLASVGIGWFDWPALFALPQTPGNLAAREAILRLLPHMVGR